MADVKITQLTELAEGPAAGDEIAIVDNSVSQTKRISVTNLNKHPDNVKSTWGAGDDLQIYHSGSHSFISDQGTGNLKILAENFAVNNPADTESMINAVVNGSVTLSWDGNYRLVTTNAGVDVTGTLTADGLTVDGDVSIIDTSVILDLMETDTTDVNTRIQHSSGDLLIRTLNDSKSAVTTRLAVDHATGDISFYEDTGTTAKFFWDASAESLGIGTSSPSSIFHAVGSGGANSTLRISNTSTLGGNWGVSAGIPALGNSGFSIYDFDNSSARLHIDSSGNVGIGTTSPYSIPKLTVTVSASGGIQSGSDVAVFEKNSDAYIKVFSSTTGEGGIAFGDSDDGFIGALNYDHDGDYMRFYVNNAERARIDSSGNLLVGKTIADNTTAGVRILGPLGFASFVRDAGEAIIVNRLTDDGDLIEFRKDGTAVGSMGTNGGYPYFANTTRGIRMVGSAIYPSYSAGSTAPDLVDIGGPTAKFKDLYLSGGVYLGGVGGSNLLDDYEEGTFTPTLTFNSGSATYTSAMRYTKIGRQVTLTGSITASAVASPSGYIQITLPFATDIATIGLYAGSVYFNDAVNKNAIDFVVNAPSVGGTSTARIYLGDVSEISSTNANAEEIQAGTTFVINLTYFTS
jgi:hypothetical protein